MHALSRSSAPILSDSMLSLLSSNIQCNTRTQKSKLLHKRPRREAFARACTHAVNSSVAEWIFSRSASRRLEVTNVNVVSSQIFHENEESRVRSAVGRCQPVGRVAYLRAVAVDTIKKQEAGEASSYLTSHRFAIDIPGANEYLELICIPTLLYVGIPMTYCQPMQTYNAVIRDSG